MNKQLRKNILNDIALPTNNFCARHQNSDEHEVAKLKEFLRLKRLGHEVKTEVKLKSGKAIFDILDITTGKIIEIMHSETLAMAKEKVKKYPKYLDVEFISV